MFSFSHDPTDCIAELELKILLLHGVKTLRIDSKNQVLAFKNGQKKIEIQANPCGLKRKRNCFSLSSGFLRFSITGYQISSYLIKDYTPRLYFVQMLDL